MISKNTLNGTFKDRSCAVSQERNIHSFSEECISITRNPRFGPSFVRYVFTHSISFLNILPSSLIYRVKWTILISIFTWKHLLIFHLIQNKVSNTKNEVTKLKTNLTCTKISQNPEMISFLISVKSPGGFSNRTWSVRIDLNKSSLEIDWMFDFMSIPDTALFKNRRTRPGWNVDS